MVVAYVSNGTIRIAQSSWIFAGLDLEGDLLAELSGVVGTSEHVGSAGRLLFLLSPQIVRVYRAFACPDSEDRRSANQRVIEVSFVTIYVYVCSCLPARS